MAGGERKSADGALIVALAAGLTNAQAAEAAGVGESTVYRRLRDPEFQQRIAEARAATIRQATDRLTAASLTAVSTLLRLLSPPTPPATRLGAARAILELGTKLREAQELEARIVTLEERLQHTEGQRYAPFRSPA